MRNSGEFNSSGNSLGGGYNLYGNLQMLGIMNAVKTGDPAMDTVLAMLLPVFMGFVFSWLNNQKDWIFQFLRKKATLQKTYRRAIAFSSTSSNAMVSSAGTTDESYNNFLIKAIELYIHSCCQLTLDEANLKLTTVSSTQVMDDEDQIVQNQSRNKATSTGQLLKHCEIIKQPLQNQWHTVGTFGGGQVSLCFEEANKKTKSEQNGSESNTRSVAVKLESMVEGAIDAFVNEAYTWYKNELKKLENDNRYLYDFCSTGGTRDSRLTPIYTRYLLAENKSFATLFCRRKTESLITMVDAFENKEGKYGVPGFPHKLGIMLHGKPGTGKTSLIKALAKHTRRQIVTIPLSRVASNQGLNAILFNKVCTVAGLQKAVKLGQEDVIFVLEDVDAASDVVLSRSLLEKRKQEEKQTKALQEQATGPAPASGVVPLSRRPPAKIISDSLSLAGLLNALDGIVDTPGRIVIMTTNHPEMLDPALVRPGRIDKSIELTDMELEDVLAMTKHYFKTKLTDEQEARVGDIFRQPSDVRGAYFEVTPAEVEQLIMAEPTVDGLINRLEERKYKNEANNSAAAKSLSEKSNKSIPEEVPAVTIISNDDNASENTESTFIFD